MHARVAVSSPPPTVTAASRFDTVSITLHWATVLLLIAMFVSAWGLSRVADGGQEMRLLTLHRSVGAAMLILAACRLAWRLSFGVRPRLALPALQKRAAAASEGALYLLLLAQPITGAAQSFARGRPFQVFVFEAPAIMVRNKALTNLFHQIHAVTAWLLLSLIALHVAAALFHGLVLRDHVLQSMAPRPLKHRPRRPGPQERAAG